MSVLDLAALRGAVTRRIGGLRWITQTSGPRYHWSVDIWQPKQLDNTR